MAGCQHAPHSSRVSHTQIFGLGQFKDDATDGFIIGFAHFTRVSRIPVANMAPNTLGREVSGVGFQVPGVTETNHLCVEIRVVPPLPP